MSAVVAGDVAELVSSSIDDCPGGCCVPAEVLPDSPPFGAYRWGCEFTATVRGSLGPAPVTISATIVGQDGSESVATDTVAVTISDEFGAIHGVLLDETSGFFLRQDVAVFIHPQGDAVVAREGVFAFGGPAPGEYRLSAGNGILFPSDYAWEWFEDASEPTDAMPVLVEAGQITRIEWRLSVGGVIEGTVVDAAGVPVAIVLVGARNAVTGTSGIGETTDTEGRFRFRGPSAGSYLIQANLGSWSDERGPVAVALGEVVGGVDFVVAGEPSDTQPPAPEPTLPNTGPPVGSASAGGLVALTVLVGGVVAVWTTRLNRPAQ